MGRSMTKPALSRLATFRANRLWSWRHKKVPRIIYLYDKPQTQKKETLNYEEFPSETAMDSDIEVTIHFFLILLSLFFGWNVVVLGFFKTKVKAKQEVFIIYPNNASIDSRKLMPLFFFKNKKVLFIYSCELKTFNIYLK